MNEKNTSAKKVGGCCCPL